MIARAQAAASDDNSVVVEHDAFSFRIRRISPTNMVYYSIGLLLVLFVVAVVTAPAGYVRPMHDATRVQLVVKNTASCKSRILSRRTNRVCMCGYFSIIEQENSGTGCGYTVDSWVLAAYLGTVHMFQVHTLTLHCIFCTSDQGVSSSRLYPLANLSSLLSPVFVSY
jgi:hypothetical protein